MSIEYTAEDFAGASFARHEDGRKAVRFEGGVNASAPSPPWQVGRFGVATDEVMAAEGGWVPVVEATEVMQHRHVDAEAHLEQIERLSRRVAKAEDHAAVAEEARRVAQRDLDDLHREIDRLERILQAPLSLKDLEVAWEAADEYATSNREQAHGVTSVLMFMHHRADRIEKEGR